MKSTYSVTEVQARLPALLRESGDHPVVITRHDKIAGYLLSPERMESILETLEIMANPQAMRELRRARAGKGRYHPLSALDEG